MVRIGTGGGGEEPEEEKREELSYSLYMPKLLLCIERE